MDSVPSERQLPTPSLFDDGVPSSSTLATSSAPLGPGFDETRAAFPPCFFDPLAADFRLFFTFMLFAGSCLIRPTQTRVSLCEVPERVKPERSWPTRLAMPARRESSVMSPAYLQQRNPT